MIRKKQSMQENNLKKQLFILQISKNKKVFINESRDKMNQILANRRQSQINGSPD